MTPPLHLLLPQTPLYPQTHCHVNSLFSSRGLNVYMSVCVLMMNLWVYPDVYITLKDYLCGTKIIITLSLSVTSYSTC